MNLFSPSELTENYALAGKNKAEYSASKLLILGVLAGMLICLGSAVTNTAAYGISNVSVQRIICGLLFPFGLGMVVITGAELFTGNCLIAISVLEKKTTVPKMLRNWSIVYIGNFIGGIIISAGCAWFGQLNYSGGQLALYTIRLAAAKCSLPFANAVVMGFFCNVLVCLGVLVSMSAKDTAGKIMGAYLPVAYFVICGFEHCVANMYFVPAGIFALQIPSYAEIAVAAGMDISRLSWGGFLLNNLLPVTVGNIFGGVFIGAIMWAGHIKNKA